MNKLYYRSKHTPPGKMFSTEGLVFEPGVTHFLVSENEMDENGMYIYFNNAPEEFAQAIRNNPNVGHTSMSISDVVVKRDGKVLACAEEGWKELKPQVWG